MKRPFTASVWREGDWYVAQCLEFDIASQGETEDEALSNLKEAVGSLLRIACATPLPQARMIEVEVGSA